MPETQIFTKLYFSLHGGHFANLCSEHKFQNSISYPRTSMHKTVFFLARGGCSEFVFRTQIFSNRTHIFSSPHASMHKTILFFARGELCEFVFRTNTNFLTPTHLDTSNNFSQMSTFRLEPRRLALRINIEECVGFAFPVAGGALHPLDQTSSLPR